MNPLLTDLIQGSHPEWTAFVEQSTYRTQAYSYSDVEDSIHNVVAAFKSHSIGKGDHVILWGRNSARWAITFYACLRSGIVVIPVDFSFSKTFVEKVRGITRAKFVCSDEESEEWNSLLQFESSKDIVREAEATLENELLEIVFTSGATGEPKGVMITHGNILSNLLPIRKEYEKYRRYARLFSPLSFVHLIPLSHLFGQIMGLFIPQMLDAAVVFSDPAALQVIRAVKENRASAVVCVPRQLSLLQNFMEKKHHISEMKKGSGGFAGVVSKWWRYRKIHYQLGWKFWAFISGGAALPTDTEHFWSNLGFAVIQGYGLTETAPSVTITHPFKGIEPGAVGKKLPGVEIKIAEDGEVLVRGPNVSPGYYQNEIATAQMFQDGWLKTGDLGRFDEKGNLHLLGRKKEVIVTSSGLNVYPEDVESVLNRDSRVRESAVVAQKTAGETTVHAVLVLNDAITAAETAGIISSANHQLEAFQKIQSHTIWKGKQLPRTSTGKLKRLAISEGMMSEATPRNAVETALHELLSNESGGPGQELALSSLDRVQLLVDLESTTGVQMDEAAFAKANTIQEIRKLIQNAEKVPGRNYPNWMWQSWFPLKIFRSLILHLLVLPVMPIRVRVAGSGIENLSVRKPPFLFVSNHQSILDVPVILKALPFSYRKLLAPAMGTGQTLLHRIAAAIFFNAYPLPQTSVGLREALDHTGKLIDLGYCPLVFPEGARTTDGNLLPFRPGIGVIVNEMKIPVIPVHLRGAFEIWPVTARGPHRKGVVQVRFDPPIDFSGKPPAVITKELESGYL